MSDYGQCPKCGDSLRENHICRWGNEQYTECPTCNKPVNTKTGNEGLRLYQIRQTRAIEEIAELSEVNEDLKKHNIMFMDKCEELISENQSLVAKAQAADGLANAVKSIDARWSGHESHQCGLTGKEHSDIRAALAAYQAALTPLGSGGLSNE